MTKKSRHKAAAHFRIYLLLAKEQTQLIRFVSGQSNTGYWWMLLLTLFQPSYYVFTNHFNNTYFPVVNYATSDLRKCFSERQPIVQYDQAVHRPALANSLDWQGKVREEKDVQKSSSPCEQALPPYLPRNHHIQWVPMLLAALSIMASTASFHWRKCCHFAGGWSPDFRRGPWTEWGSWYLAEMGRWQILAQII